MTSLLWRHTLSTTISAAHFLCQQLGHTHLSLSFSLYYLWLKLRIPIQPQPLIRKQTNMVKRAKPTRILPKTWYIAKWDRSVIPTSVIRHHSNMVKWPWTKTILTYWNFYHRVVRVDVTIIVLHTKLMPEFVLHACCFFIAGYRPVSKLPLRASKNLTHKNRAPKGNSWEWNIFSHYLRNFKIRPFRFFPDCQSLKVDTLLNFECLITNEIHKIKQPMYSLAFKACSS